MRTARSRKTSFFVLLSNRLSTSAAAADWYRENPFASTVRRDVGIAPYEILSVVGRRAGCPHPAAVQRRISYRCTA